MSLQIGYRICEERNVTAAFVHFMPHTGVLAAAEFCLTVLRQRLAYFCRKALISSTRSWGSPAAWLNEGWLPTTRFIHSMLSCIRATTAGHSFAVWRLGSGSTWHWLQARRNASPEGAL